MLVMSSSFPPPPPAPAKGFLHLLLMLFLLLLLNGFAVLTSQGHVRERERGKHANV